MVFKWFSKNLWEFRVRSGEIFLLFRCVKLFLLVGVKEEEDISRDFRIFCGPPWLCEDNDLEFGDPWSSFNRPPVIFFEKWRGLEFCENPLTFDPLNWSVSRRKNKLSTLESEVNGKTLPYSILLPIYFPLFSRYSDYVSVIGTSFWNSWWVVSWNLLGKYGFLGFWSFIYYYLKIVFII